MIKKEDLKLEEYSKAIQKANYLLKELLKVNEILKKYDIDLTDNFKLVEKQNTNKSNS